MKQKIYHIIIFLLFWFCGVAYSQNPKADILQQDLSGLFDNLSMIGILGEDCSRIDIHITEVRKMDSREYEIKGISRTRLSVICPFKGKVCVDSISSCSQMIKSEYTELDGFIYGYYSFAEYGDKRTLWCSSYSLLNHCLIIIQTIQRIGDFCFIGVRYVQINCRCFYIGMSHKFLYGS